LGLAPDEYAALTMVLLRLLAFKPPTGQQPVAEKKTPNNALNAAPRAVVVPALEPAAAAVPALHTPPPVTAPASVAQPVASPAQSRVPPWEDEPDRVPTPVEQARDAIKIGVMAEQSPKPPPGQQLPVVSMPMAPAQPRVYEQNEALAPAESVQAATKIVAIPVRVQADSRTEAVAGQSAAVLLIPSEEGEFWHRTVQQLIAGDAITALVRELALQSQLVARDIDQWLLRVERESLNQPGSRDRLATALQATGHGVRLVVEIGRVTDSPARRNAAAAAERQLAAEKIIFDDPFVQTMMRDFGAKIVPGSIKPG
jgi:DNA polymerase-3 subunit gamma/tau